MTWTDERVDVLKKLWADGLSASQIAAQLGGVSRNAVIGKVHRMKLSSRGRAAPAAAAPKKKAVTPQPTIVVQKPVTAAPIAAAPRPVPQPAPAPQPQRIMTHSVGATALQAQFDEQPETENIVRLADNVVPISRRLHLLQLTERTCKWPHGDPMAEDFSFCGHESNETSPYCNYHAGLAFQPASERRRAR